MSFGRVKGTYWEIFYFQAIKNKCLKLTYNSKIYFEINNICKDVNSYEGS